MKPTTTYYGKDYGLVYSSPSAKEVSIYADIINKTFGDYNHGKKRVKMQKVKTLILIEHMDMGNSTKIHGIYIKKPYDKLVRKI